MANYVIADIHGEYDAFEELLAKISFGDEDTLYILGDVLDRGPNPIKVMRKLMTMPNAICIAGNHEVMALECLEFLLQEISNKAIENLDQVTLDKLVTWQYNGASTTINEFRKLSVSEREDVIAFIQDFSAYEEVSVGEKEYLLVHAGVNDYVTIQRIRFDNRFHLDLDISSEYLDNKVLKLILQPLVENALYHGLNYCTTGDTITIRAYTENNCLMIDVHDNGQGMDIETLTKLQSSLMEEASFTELGHRNKQSIGLKNIHSRIELYYGKGYGLTVTSIHGEWTNIQIRLPILK